MKLEGFELATGYTVLPNIVGKLLPLYGFFAYAWTLAILCACAWAYVCYRSIGWVLGKRIPFVVAIILGIGATAPANRDPWLQVFAFQVMSLLILAIVSVWGYLRWTSRRD